MIATADTPLVTLAGPTNALRWRPVTTRWRLLSAQDFGVRRAGPGSLGAIPVDVIEAAVLDFLADPRGWRPQRDCAG